jgi:hypothetical protein
VNDKLIDVLILADIPQAADEPEDTIAGAIQHYGPPDQDSAHGPVKGFPDMPPGTVAVRALRWRSRSASLLLDIRRWRQASPPRLFLAVWLWDPPGVREWLRTDERAGGES